MSVTDRRGGLSSSALNIIEWLVDQALGTHSAAESFGGLVKMLRAEGVPLARAHLAHTTLHPLYAGEGVTWTLEEGLVEESYEHGRGATVSGWAASPIRYAVSERLQRLRRRLQGEGATLDFPILKEFAEKGLTDYLLLTIGYDSFFAPQEQGFDMSSSSSGMAVSFAASRETGFTDGELALMETLLRPLATVVKMADQRQVALNLAECYIGKEAGPRVLGGAIQRGDFASTKAVVFMADLRASTELSNELTRDEYVATINAFFDCASGAVEAEGGEPLTFIGDGVLAIFPIEAMGEQAARRAAHAAALGATTALSALNATRKAQGQQQLRWGIALHAGELDYGNIGSPTRHSWSVIGPVVNETARLEGTTKETGEPIVASHAFVNGLDADAGKWRSLGTFALRGVPSPLDVYAPPTNAPAAANKKEIV